MARFAWIVTGIALAFSPLAGPVAAKTADAPEADANYKVLNCYRKAMVKAQYKVSKKLVKPAERKYVQKGNMIELREYPAVYQEIRTKIKDEYFLMQEVPCKPKS